MAREDVRVDGALLSEEEFSALEGELFALVRSLEEAFSLEIEGSDLSRLRDAAAGETVAVCEDTEALFSLSEELADMTDEKFTPALLPLTELWGFAPADAGSYNDARPEPSAQALAAAREASSLSLFSAVGGGIVKEDGRAALDLGGIAKGYICDAVVSFLRERYAGHALDGIVKISSSNSAYLGNARREGEAQGYTVGIENPRRLSTGVADGLFLVDVADAAVTTSADNYRFYVWEDKIYPHIIDEETGKPADRGIIGVTVVVPETAHPYAGALADALSTAAFCMPLTGALSFLEEMAQAYGLGAVIVARDFRYYAVGEVHVLGRKDYASYCNRYLGTQYDVGEIEEVFTEGDADAASDEVLPCAQELAYIARVKEVLYGA